MIRAAIIASGFLPFAIALAIAKHDERVHVRQLDDSIAARYRAQVGR